MRGDERLRELGRKVASTSSPNDAKLYLVEAVRSGRWLVTTDRYRDNVRRRLGTLRFLGYLGWNDAIGLLRALPWRGEVTPSAMSVLGRDVVEEICTVVLDASAAAACMSASHLLPHGLDVQEALRVFGELIEVERRWRERPTPSTPLGADKAGTDLYSELQRAQRRAWEVAGAFRPDHHLQDTNLRSPGARAVRCAREAWAELMTACHETDRPRYRSDVIFQATYALAWEAEPDIPEEQRPPFFSDEWRALPESHWIRAMRPRGSVHDRHGAKPSTGALRVASRRIKRAMLGPALVAACSLVGT